MNTTRWTLQPEEFASLQSEGHLVIGTLRNRIARELFQNLGARGRTGAEDAAFGCDGNLATA